MELTNTIQELIMIKVETVLRSDIIPKFWSYFKNEEIVKAFHKFVEAVEFLFKHFINLNKLMNSLEILINTNDIDIPIMGEMNPRDALKLILRATLFSQHDSSYEKIISYFYEDALFIEDLDRFSSKQCPVCSVEHCRLCRSVFLAINWKLGHMSLLGPLTDQALTHLIYNYITMYIQRTCKDNFDVSYLNLFEKWLDRIIIEWLKKFTTVQLQIRVLFQNSIRD
ncbi:hypothetical protein HHI36_020867 [Cryptolaemus montrouzieri]|uniref:Uncharacterized protein n=1 Tax=Cryptolaemus montrouzieri TaxID=559131 RepID=A0ABD2NC49_9CUCU